MYWEIVCSVECTGRRRVPWKCDGRWRVQWKSARVIPTFLLDVNEITLTRAQ